MNGEFQQLVADGVRFRYSSSRVPRVVDIQVSAPSCPLLPPPVQVIRGASPEEQELISGYKPSYLLVKFENPESPKSTPLADLTSLY